MVRHLFLIYRGCPVEGKVGVGKNHIMMLSYQVIKINKMRIINYIGRRSPISSLPKLISIMQAVTLQPLSNQLLKLLGVLLCHNHFPLLNSS